MLSDDELVAAGLDPEELANPRLVRAAALVDGIEEFDAAFFGITGREAEVMDPQHRVFLECAWHALEDAGYDPERYDGAIGVFGASTATRSPGSTPMRLSADASRWIRWLNSL